MLEYPLPPCQKSGRKIEVKNGLVPHLSTGFLFYSWNKTTMGTRRDSHNDHFPAKPRFMKTVISSTIIVLSARPLASKVLKEPLALSLYTDHAQVCTHIDSIPLISIPSKKNLSWSMVVLRNSVFFKISRSSKGSNNHLLIHSIHRSGPWKMTDPWTTIPILSMACIKNTYSGKWLSFGWFSTNSIPRSTINSHHVVDYHPLVFYKTDCGRSDGTHQNDPAFHPSCIFACHYLQIQCGIHISQWST